MPEDRPWMYTASLPVFAHYLHRLRHLLDRAASHAAATGRDPDDLLQARLAADMRPLHEQVAIAAHFSLRACFPLAGQDVPAWGDFPASLDGLRGRIDRALALLGTLPAEAFASATSRVLTAQAGDACLSLPAPEFLTRFALPNFFFHVTTAHDLLRHQGVPVGKADFDGYHRYPAG